MTTEVINAFSGSSESGVRSEKRLLSDREMEVVQLVDHYRCSLIFLSRLERLHFPDSTLPSVLSLPLRTRPAERYAVVL